MTQPSAKLKNLLDTRTGASEELSDENINNYIEKITEALMAKPAKRPYQGPTHLDHLVGEFRIEFDTMTDGTTTEVLLRDPTDPTVQVGRGVARRRKGDRRDVLVGQDIALARALRDFANRAERGTLR